jgi:hypothetical protein
MATSISAVSGTFGLDNSLTISGSGFGTKTRSKPLSYCDFQNGSLQPNSAVSNNTTLASIQNVSFVNSAEKRWGNGGVGSAAWLRNSTAPGNSATLQVATSWGSSNRNLFVFAYRKWLNADTTGNWKTWRFWPGTDGNGGYPDVYLGCPEISGANGTGWVWSIEGVSFTEGVNHKWLAQFLQPTSSWRSEMLVMKAATSTTAVDGSLAIYFNGLGGTEVTTDSNFTFTFSGATAFPSTVYLQDTKASSNPGGSMQSFYSDFYVDESHNQVFMGNAATFAACTHIEVQPFTAWADGSITIKQRPGTFSSGTNTYLYVTDVNFSPNATGYNLSNLNPSPTPPTLVSLSPGSGPTTGKTGVVGTGTGYAAGMTGAVAGTALANMVINSATQFTADFPAKAAGVYNVVLTKTDLTTGTLLNGWTAVSAPTVTSCSLQITAAPTVWTGPLSFNTAPHWTQVAAGFGPAKVVVNGTNIRAGASVTFADIPGGTPHAATNVVVLSSTQLTCDLPFVTGGLQSVVITNTDGQTSGTTGDGKFNADSTPWIFAVQPTLNTLGDGLFSSSLAWVAWAENTPGGGFTFSVAGTPVTASLVHTYTGYGMQLLAFKAPAHAAGSVSLTLTNTVAGSSYTFVNGGTYVAPSGGSGLTGAGG